MSEPAIHVWFTLMLNVQFGYLSRLKADPWQPGLRLTFGFDNLSAWSF